MFKEFNAALRNVRKSYKMKNFIIYVTLPSGGHYLGPGLLLNSILLIYLWAFIVSHVYYFFTRTNFVRMFAESVLNDIHHYYPEIYTMNPAFVVL